MWLLSGNGSEGAQVEFADLNLSFGYPIQMQVKDGDGQKRRYFCRLIGCAKGNYVLLSHLVTGRQGNCLNVGDTVVARLMIGTGIGIFPATVDHIQKHPQPLVYIDYPRWVEFKQIRGAERIDTGLAVQVRCSDDPQRHTSGTILDISASGARLELVQAVVDIDDRVTISGDFAVHDLSSPLTLAAIIRTRINDSAHTHLSNQNGSMAVTTYGVEFTETDPHQLLPLYAYVYHRLANNYLPRC